MIELDPPMASGDLSLWLCEMTSLPCLHYSISVKVVRGRKEVKMRYEKFFIFYTRFACQSMSILQTCHLLIETFLDTNSGTISYEGLCSK